MLVGARQVEVHHPGGELEVLYPDGAACVTDAAGREVGQPVLSSYCRLPVPQAPC